MSNVNLRRMTVEDVDGVHAIEEATFAKPWSRQSFYEEMTRNVCARYLVAETELGEIIGFAGVWIVMDEGHITNIAVRQDCVDLDTVAAVSPRDDFKVNLHSEGFAPVSLDLEEIGPIAGEQGTPASLIRGIARRMREKGIQIRGFDACAT